MVGKVLGNRYEILEKVGTGGMSVVYKAKCRLLNRYVAIKILRQDFIDNEEFIKRFKIEAQAAASLSHPNIVSIYDVGNQDELYYIVMEYVDGITLKEYITKKRILGWKESVEIAVQICSALEHAHKNGIVHRDIKPHNIIITSEGTAKVTDFGIARAATFFTVTFAGNAIGSVHYFSPEQARGGYTDNKSDIYSLGVVLYEMLTGIVPFEGDSPVSIAFKHIQQNPTPPKEINNSIPSSLNNVVLKAMSKELEKRYSAVTSMFSDLNEVLKHPEQDIVSPVEQDDEVDSPTLVIPPVNATKSKGSNEQSEGVMKNTDNNTKTPKTKKDRKTLYAAIATSVVIMMLLAFTGYKFVFSTKPAEVSVPNLIGKTEDEARDILSKSNLTFKVKARRSDETVLPGLIIEQSPSVGIPVKLPNEVSVVVSTGKKEIQVPNIEKKDYREAQFEVEKIGLTAKITYESSETIPINFVTRTNPMVGSIVNQGSGIEIFVSNGPSVNTIPMPNIIGKTEVQAKKILAENKLTYGTVSYDENTAAYGTVINQSVSPNSAVTEGTKINLTLSAGKSTPKTIPVKIYLPQDKPTVFVEVLLITKDKQVIAYQKTHKRSDSPVVVNVTGAGKGSIQVKFDGVLKEENSINFEGAR